MKTAIDAVEELHSPKSNGEAAKQTFSAREGYSNRSYSMKRRSRGMNMLQQDSYDKCYEDHRPVEDGSI
jgi:hypothetical protein